MLNIERITMTYMLKTFSPILFYVHKPAIQNPATAKVIESNNRISYFFVFELK